MAETLEQRISQLERENRKLKRIGMCLIVAASVAVLAGSRLPESARVVEAERFVLRDEHGRICAEWKAEGNKASLAFVNATEEKLLSLGVRDTRFCWLTLRDEGDKGEVGMLMSDTGTPQFNISHSDHGHIYLTVNPERELALDFLNKARQGLIAIQANQHGRSLTLADDESDGQLSLQVNKGGRPAVGITDHAGTPQIEVFVDKDRQPHLKWEGQDIGRLPAAP